VCVSFSDAVASVTHCFSKRAKRFNGEMVVHILPRPFAGLGDGVAANGLPAGTGKALCGRVCLLSVRVDVAETFIKNDEVDVMHVGRVGDNHGR
jgi:hypothetical protein